MNSTTAERLVFRGGRVWDGTGAAPARADVSVQDGRVVEVGPGLDGDTAVDCTGLTVLPGLFDCHVHLMFTDPDPLALLKRPFSLQFYESVQNMRRTIDAGITSVRDATGADLGLKVAQRRSVVVGPRVQLSIAMISQTGGHADSWEACGGPLPLFVPHPGRPDAVVDGPDLVRKKVRELIRAGADVIKVATTGGVLSSGDNPLQAHFTDEEIAAIVSEANAAGRAVMAHASGSEGIKAAIRNGVRSIEHGDFLDDEAIDMMLERGVWLVPTIASGLAILRDAQTGVINDPEILDKAEWVVEAQKKSVRAAVEAGVPIAMGTDAPSIPHGDNLCELEQLVEYGMSPVEAWRSATVQAARLLRVDDELGTLEPGKRADVVLLRGGLDDVANLRNRIHAVYQDGTPVTGQQS